MSEPSDKRRRTIFVLRLLSFIHKIKQSVPVITGKIMPVFAETEADFTLIEIFYFKVIVIGINESPFAVKIPYLRGCGTA